jgi:hypothetical protein
MIRRQTDLMRIPTKVPRRAAIVMFIAVAVLVNCVLFVLLGFRQGGDAARYLAGADRLLQGQPLSERQQVYFGYIWLLAAVKGLGIDQRVVYLIQVGASCAAAVAALQLGRLYGGSLAGIITALAWAFCYEIQKWNFYFLTESLFFSSVMVSCWLIMRPLEKRSNLVVALVSLLVMASLRFNGVVFALVILAVLLVAVRDRVSRALVAVALLVLVLIPSASAVSPFRGAAREKGLAREGTLGFLTEGQVIWKTVRIPMPPASEGSGSLPGDLARYIVAHPLAVSRLYLYRLGHYLFAYNPLFSTKHIVATTAQWLLVYAFALSGWLAIRRRGNWGMTLLPALFVCQGVLVMLTVGDYDGRYSLYAAPSLFPFVGVGLSEALSARLGLPPAQSARV